MKKQLIILLTAVLLICVGLSGCFDTNAKISVDDIELLEYMITYAQSGNPIINGTARNNGDVKASRISIKAKFYDENDVMLYTGIDAIYDVSPGEEFVFEIGCYKNYEFFDHYSIWVDSVYE